MPLQISLPSLRLVSLSLDDVFPSEKTLILMKSMLSIISLMDYAFGIIYEKKIIPYSKF